MARREGQGELWLVVDARREKVEDRRDSANRMELSPSGQERRTRCELLRFDLPRSREYSLRQTELELG